jgi:hypothetical protein
VAKGNRSFGEPILRYAKCSNPKVGNPKDGWRAVYIERCKCGSGEGLQKPDSVMNQGVGFLSYDNDDEYHFLRASGGDAERLEPSYAGS